MNAREITLETIGQLPAAVLRRLNLGNPTEIEEAVSVHLRIRAHNKFVYEGQRELRLFKQKRGFCGGLPWCERKLGRDAKHKTCDSCRAILRDQRERAERGQTRKMKQSEYGLIQKIVKKSAAEAKEKAA
jgi:hypothetical protein